MLIFDNAAAVQTLIVLTILLTILLVSALYILIKRYLATRILVRAIHPDGRESRHYVKPEKDGMLRVPTLSARYTFENESVYWSALPFLKEPVATVTVRVAEAQALNLRNGSAVRDELTAQSLETAFDNKMLETWARATKEFEPKKILNYIVLSAALIVLINIIGMYYLANNVLVGAR